MRTFSLSLHADYACAHSGACCTAGWAIPVEPPKQHALGSALLIPDGNGRCRFFEASSRLCAVHRDHGEQALPDSCRHFPRVALVDERGVHITLSHFCPTAAGQLFRSDVPLAIVEAPPAFPLTRDYEGLDARREWPPLIHDALLFDLDGYSAWESFVVSAFAEGNSRNALERIATAAEHVREWRPDGEPLATLIHRLRASSEIAPSAIGRYEPIRSNAVAIVYDAIPEPLRRGLKIRAHANASAHALNGIDDRVVCRYLAAKAFASWTAYQGHGVRTLVAELVVVDALLEHFATTHRLIEAIREADRWLIHLASRPPLVTALGVVEDAGRDVRRPTTERSKTAHHE